VTCQIEESERFIIQASVPEAMVIGEDFKDLDAFDAIGVGPGWGVENREKQLEFLLQSFSKPMVLDADALNVLSKNPELMSLLPKNSILTPHLGEFERLVGNCVNHPDRMKKASDLAKKYQIVLVLKGANTLISLPDGRQLFNSTGTHFMATGGAGDVLTGMITAFLGMGYSPENAAICGVFHHGLAGEYAGKIRFQGTIASDIIEQIPRTFEFVENS
jgi:NAD(P)H-hydrate epimerase